MRVYQPILRCSECGDAMLFLADEQQARRAAAPERFVILCFLCEGDWRGELEPGNLDGDG